MVSKCYHIWHTWILWVQSSRFLSGFPISFPWFPPEKNQIRCLEAGRNLSARPATTKKGSRTGGLNMVTSTCPETCTIFVYIVNNSIYICILYSMCMHACMHACMYVCMIDNIFIYEYFEVLQMLLTLKSLGLLTLLCWSSLFEAKATALSK